MKGFVSLQTIDATAAGTVGMATMKPIANVRIRTVKSSKGGRTNLKMKNSEKCMRTINSKMNTVAKKIVNPTDVW